MNLSWDDFKKNVTQWAEERGIYEHSTAEAQLMKALSELGELADAIIKNDIDGIRDGVGDYLVCIVNYANMSGIDLPYRDRHAWSLPDSLLIGRTANQASNLLKGEIDVMAKSLLLMNIDVVNSIAEKHGLKLEQCQAAAWNEIRHRKGRVVKGGAFIKDE